MQIQDDRTEAEKWSHTVYVVGHDKGMSGWGKASGGASWAGWACRPEDEERVLAWVRARGDLRQIGVHSHLFGFQRKDRRGHLHVYVVRSGHPALQSKNPGRWEPFASEQVRRDGKRRHLCEACGEPIQDWHPADYGEYPLRECRRCRKELEASRRAAVKQYPASAMQGANNMKPACQQCGSKAHLHKVKYAGEAGIGSMMVCDRCEDRQFGGKSMKRKGRRTRARNRLFFARLSKGRKEKYAGLVFDSPKRKGALARAHKLADRLRNLRGSKLKMLRRRKKTSHRRKHKNPELLLVGLNPRRGRRWVGPPRAGGPYIPLPGARMYVRRRRYSTAGSGSMITGRGGRKQKRGFRGMVLRHGLRKAHRMWKGKGRKRSLRRRR